MFFIDVSCIVCIGAVVGIAAGTFVCGAALSAVVAIVIVTRWCVSLRMTFVNIGYQCVKYYTASA